MPVNEKLPSAKEPADVRRVAASEGAGAKPGAGEPVELAATAGPAKLSTLPFFEMLAQMKERDWEDRIVYLYRQGNEVIKADPKDANYIERIPHAFDEEYVKKKHGGGRFLAILKNTRINGAERKHSFLIEGPPIVHSDEVMVSKKGEAGPGQSDTAALLAQLNTMMDRLIEITAKQGGSEGDAVAKVVDTMKKATDGVLDVQKAAFEKQLNSASGNPIADKLMEATIKRLDGGDNSLGQLKEMLLLAKALQPESAGKPGLLGVVSELKGLAEAARELGIKIGGGEAAVEGADWKSALVSVIPSALQTLGAFIQDMRNQSYEQTRVLAALQAGQPAPARVAQTSANPAPLQPLQPPQPAVMPPAASGSPLPANFASGPPAEPAPAGKPDGNVIAFPDSNVTSQINWELVVALIRRSWDRSDTGQVAALVLKRIYEEHMDAFKPFFADERQLQGFAALAPALAEIMNEADWPEFVRGFCAEINRNEDQPPAG